MNIERILERYPKRREPLPPEYQRIADAEYAMNRAGERGVFRLVQWTEAWMHRIVARRAIPGQVLELGAGRLNHVPYESALAYDVVEPYQRAYANSPLLGRIGRVHGDISELAEGSRYDRVISIAVLEHLERLPEVVARSALLLKEGGVAQHAFPSEGGMLWGLAWRCSTGISFRLRNRLPYKTFMHHEHVNTEREILAVLRWFHRSVWVRRFPLPGRHFSFYTYAELHGPQTARAQSYLRQMPR